MSASRRKRLAKKPAAAAVAAKPGTLAADIRQMIEGARQQIAQTVNVGLTLLHWQIGSRIHREILQEKRADDGAQIVSTLSRQLVPEFGRGFSDKALWHIVRFAETFPQPEIVSTLSRQLAWSHFKEVIYLKDDLKRDFYAEMCRIERWSVRTLRQKIDGMLYERTVTSKKPEKLIRRELQTLRAEDKVTPDLVFQDPYLLDFLGLKDTERIMEA
jgi:hypothetical protein